MRVFVHIIITLLVIGQFAVAQESKPIYFEEAPKNMVRFFFDKNYYLVDKHCEFKFIERVATFSASKNIFTGPFKDFGPNGHVILTGQYVNGKKEGLFIAYHPNGHIKWEANYLDDEEQGIWKYYYPDGKPMLELSLENGDFSIINYFDQYGKQRVTNGNGIYEIIIPIDHYTEHGFTKFNRKGKVVNGKPDDEWLVSFVSNDKKNTKYPVYLEIFDNGTLKTRNIADEFLGVLIDPADFYYAPVDYFSRGELLYSKNCSFDEHTGFNNFIARKFQWFLKYWNFTLEESTDMKFSYRINITEKGTSKKIEVLNDNNISSDLIKTYLEPMIKQINWYLPSYLDNQPIADTLTINVHIQNVNNEIYVNPVQIKRERGY